MSHSHKSVRILLSLVMLMSIGLSVARAGPVSAQGGDGIRRQINPQTGKVSFIGPEKGRSLAGDKALGISASDRAADPAMALARRFAPEFGLQNPERDLQAVRTASPGDGRLTVYYQQTFEGIPVLGGELVVNTNQNGDLYSINGEVSSLPPQQTQPAVDSEQARRTAIQALAKWYQRLPESFSVSEPELWIYDESLLRPSTRPVELAWRMEVTAVDTAMPVRELVLVHAERGSISLHFNQIDTAWSGNSNAARGSEKNILTGPQPALQAGATSIRTYTANNSTTLPGTFLCDQSTPTCPSGDAQAKAAHKHAIGTYNLYKNEHNRNSIDNQNMPILSTVHYDFLYPNAFWSGDQMVYGDGYGFALADDVVAHELTHGVTQHGSNLFYFYQSGAINESFSDLWGEYYDQTNGQGTDTAGAKWQIGEDISGLGAIRSMSNPPAFSNPDKMSSSLYVEGSEDNGGVHSNSGLNNKAAFLMVDGGAFNGRTVSALGWAKVAAIYYEVNTHLLSSGADYSDLYFALQKACSTLIGQKGITATDCQEVKDAIDAVEMNAQPAPNFNTDAALCVAGTPTLTFGDDFENGAGQWTFSNGGITRWQIDSPYGPNAQSGLHSLYADDTPAAITDATARLASFTVPNGGYLHFSQSYEFETFDFGETYYFDGGVLEYSTDSGSTWLDGGPLIEVNGYKGTIYNDWSNPLKGRSGFVGSSHGYISTRLNLASLAGKTVTFRWRIGLDDIGSAWGWWVDNIKVYTCKNTPAGAALVSPSGNIGANYNPTYTWNKVSNATWYYVWVDGPAGNLIKKWYEASLVCGASTCSVTPATTLGGGDHTWWIQTWNESGYGPWSSAMNFSITAPTLPGAATLVAPAGSIGANYQPTYKWNKVSGATWYYLWVDGPSGNVIKTWYEASTICGASACSVKPATTLSGGAYSWWIQTWNAAGYGPWSPAMGFRTTIPTLPGAATLISPLGVSTDTTPDYTWNKVSDAAWYYLWISRVNADGSLATVHAAWYESTAVCSSSACSFSPAVTLTTGNYRWWIQTWNAGGFGPWSTQKDFSIP